MSLARYARLHVRSNLYSSLLLARKCVCFSTNIEKSEPITSPGTDEESIGRLTSKKKKLLRLLNLYPPLEPSAEIEGSSVQTKADSGVDPPRAPLSKARRRKARQKAQKKSKKEKHGRSNDSDVKQTQRSSTAHRTSYTYRIEGVIEPFEGTVLEDLESPTEQRPIVKLAHGLDRVLFNPGVHWLQDPRSQVYNFTPWLQKVPDVKDFAFERVTGFIPSSRDNDLRTLAKQENREFTGSTSSLTGLLSQIYFLISGDMDVDVSTLSSHFRSHPTNFTPGQRMPVDIELKFEDEIYAIDSASLMPGHQERNILRWLGTLLEKFLTASPPEFGRLLRATPLDPTDEPVDTLREAYRYSKSRKIVMRSQLDCQDNRLPGTGVFDLKTRAALPLRMDIYNYEEHSGYMIRRLQGVQESFEREYYDLIRSAFLKYSFQARIGNMDGVLVAFHNTARIFGFQYIPLEEMEERLFGGQGRGDRIFAKCVSFLEILLPQATRCFSNQSVRCVVESREGRGVMHIWVEPSHWNEAENGPAPLVQLDVTATNYLDGKEATSRQAIAAVDSSWSIHWTVSQSSLPEDEIRRGLNGARERQLRTWSLPSGLGLSGMAERWKEMAFGHVLDDVPFDPLFFRKSDKHVETLRRLSRQGKLDLKQMELAAQGQPKIVLGQSPEFADDMASEQFSSVAEGTETLDTTESVTSAVFPYPSEQAGQSPTNPDDTSNSDTLTDVKDQ